MADNITIEGLEDCLRCLDKAPENALKMTRTAMRKAGKDVATAMRNDMPKRWRRLVKSKIIRQADGQTSALIGLYNGHQRQGHQPKNNEVEDWFKAYWANYGTLTHRDPNHVFSTAVKRAQQRTGKNGNTVSERRNNVGQRAQKFFDPDGRGYTNMFVEMTERYIAEENETLYDR